MKDGDFYYPPAARILASALVEDPFYAAISSDLEKRSEDRLDCLSSYFEYSLREGEQIGLSVVPRPEIYGAAIWNMPQPEEIQQRADALKMVALGGVLGERGFAAYTAILEFMHPRVGLVVPPAAWYLSILGVDPARQGHGLGAVMLAPTLALADRAGVATYLETFSPRNIRFYERLGFSTRAVHHEPVSAADYWIMVRDPHG